MGRAAARHDRAIEAPLLGEGRFNSFANRVHLALNPEPPKAEAKAKPPAKSDKENGDK